MNKTVIVSVCVLFALSARAERYEFDRYQPIVDRQMFGPVPEGFDPTKPPSEVQKSAGGKSEKELTKEQEQVKKSVRFSMINLNPKGETMVGFTDSSNPKEVRHYYLKVGETRDGWTVKAADAVAATVSISKDGVDLDLELGSGSSGGAPVAAGKSAGPAVGGLGGGIRRGGLLGGRAPGSGGMFSGAAGSLRERRMAKMQQREANEKAAAEDQAKRDAEAAAEKAKAEEEKAQREAEREQQRQQLMQIQEELKKAREARQAAEAAEKENADSSATSDE